jgi:hypothetical protein
MKRKTEKIIVHRPAAFAALALAAVLIMAGCTQPTGAGGSPGSSGKGIVNIQLGIDNEVEDIPASMSIAAARTLLPGSVTGAAFDAYDLVFTVVTGESGTAESFTGVTSLTAVLDTGKYDLALSAKKAGIVAAEGEYKNISVTEGSPANVTVPLVFKPEAGDGTLSFTVTRPEGLELTDAQFTLTPLHSGGTSYGTDWLKNMYTGEKKTTHSSNESIASGYYQAVVTLSTAERKAVKTDIVHIGAGQTTTLNWAFDLDDFSTVVTNIWLVGAMNNWMLPGIPMTLEANGTFTWEGEIGSDDPAFRFSLTNTTGWDDPWNGNWFAPSITSVSDTRESVNVGSNISMVFAPTNTNEGATTATNSAWKMNAAGYYRLIVNPYAKTFNIEAPAVVTGVVINGGNITMNQGASNSFTAVVNGHNSPSQEVTWSVTGGSGTTAFSGNTLTIYAAEPAAALTVRATSTEDSTKYGEITVAVQGATAPVVTSIVVTAAGNATEVLLTATLQFSKTVTAGNGATEDVTWSVSGKNKDGVSLGSVTSSIDASGLLTVTANEEAVDLVVRATSQQAGYTNISGEATVFVRKIGAVYLTGDEFGNWTDTGTVELPYSGRGVYAKTVLMSKGKYFRFRDNSSTPNHFEPYPHEQGPNGTVDAWKHEPTQNTAWKTTQGGSYAISLDTVNEKVTFTRTDVTGVTVEVTYGHPMTAVTKINGEVAPKGTVTWTVEKSGSGADPYNNTNINQDGWLALDNYEPTGKQMIVRATSNYNDAASGTCTFTIGKYPNVWLVGAMQGWSLPGALMQRSQDGQTFTWQGTITNGDYFRFNRTDPITADSSTWQRNWLGITWNNDNPRQIDTGSTGDSCTVAEWDNQNPDGNKANWQFSGATGTYKIIMDVSAMAIRIEAVP